MCFQRFTITNDAAISNLAPVCLFLLLLEIYILGQFLEGRLMGQKANIVLLAPNSPS